MATLLAKQSRASEIFKRLKKLYPKADCELNFTSPLQLLVATILSAQCTDARVNEVTPALFKRYTDAKAFAKAESEELKGLIRSTGFFQNKARSIQDCCMQIVMEHKGDVPESMEALVALSGVGRKTANLVRSFAFGHPGIICDTHVLRVTKRLGLTENTKPEKVEADLAAIVPEKDWTRFSTAVMWHGRRCCNARKPDCAACTVRDLCPSAVT